MQSPPAFPATDPSHAPALPPSEARPARRPRAALVVLQLAAIAVVLAAAPYTSFELDRFFVPKELVMHAAALAVGVLLFGRIRALRFGPADMLLVLFLAASAASALLATNGWLAVRALAVTASGLVVFWAARALRDAGLARPLLHALALAVVIGAATSLAQTYGVESALFSENRAPGGTFGNRNSVAHVAALGVPVVLLAALRARSAWGFLFAAVGAAPVLAALVLTRSRAGWLAVAAALGVLLAAQLVAPALRRDRRGWRRFAALVLLAVAGVAAAVAIPNGLRWQSDSPYRDSIRGVANYQDGSGAGRLVQYRRSLELATTRPLLGVGPGNWPVAYPAHAPAGDPSLSGSQPGTTSNPWPSSDWVAYISERGFPAALMLALAFLAIAGRTAHELFRRADPDRARATAALLATLAAATVAGLLDAVLLLAHPALIVWAALGALLPGATVPEAVPHGTANPAAAPPGRSRAAAAAAWAVPLVLAVSAVGATRSAAQLASIAVYDSTRDVATLARAARIDPGNYRLRLRLARAGSGLPRAARCDEARAAHALFPEAREARNLARGCGG